MSSRNPIVEQNDVIAWRAAEWLLELQSSEIDMDRIAAWQKWLAEDASHKQAFDRLQSLRECVASVRTPPWPTDREVAADQYDGTVALSAWWERDGQNTRSRRPTPRPRWIMAALAASLALVIFGVVALVDRSGVDWSMPSLWDPAIIATDIGELRRVQLPDGSTVTLGGHTRIAVDIGAVARTIPPDRGEAFFEVAKDAGRPFIVNAAGTKIRAVGTAFDVRRTGEQVSVAVAEGIVELAPLSKSASRFPALAAPSDPAGARVPSRLAAGERILLEPRQARAHACSHRAGGCGDVAQRLAPISC